MTETYVSAAQFGGTGLLDWIICLGFAVVLSGVPAFRVIAAWRGWLSDE